MATTRLGPDYANPASRERKHVLANGKLTLLEARLNELEEFIESLKGDRPIAPASERLDKQPLPGWIEWYETLSPRIDGMSDRLGKCVEVLREILL